MEPSKENTSPSMSMGTSFSRDIVRKTQESWLKNVPHNQVHVRLFEEVRDIPYKVVPEICHHDNGPRGILLYGAGSCSPKHFLLGSMMERAGIEVRYVSYPFFWQHQPLPYPPELCELAKTHPVEYHLALKCRINDRWLTVDATWDPTLIKIGFPGILDWKGDSSTPLAVNPVDEIVHANAQEREAYVQTQRSHRRLNDSDGGFYGGMNAWFAAVRSEAERVSDSQERPPIV